MGFEPTVSAGERPQTKALDHAVTVTYKPRFNPLNAEINPVCHLLALLGNHQILHVGRIRFNNRYYRGCHAPRLFLVLCLIVRTIALPLFIPPTFSPVCHLLALLGTHHILHVGRIRFNNRYYRGCHAPRLLLVLCLIVRILALPPTSFHSPAYPLFLSDSPPAQNP